ncbi:MAG TPA: TraR/DksA C4-type zinc finger protein [Thermomicrobiales bacterium]|nr:TraR/DksA C4-type zinc finger protein [Thermomicrobiales bacterium]
MPTREKQFESIRHELEEDLRTTRASLGDMRDETDDLARDSDQEGGVPTNHMADVGTNVYERERLMTFQQEMRDRATAIQDALERMDDGTYCVCERCGKTIPIQRLRAMPFTRYCVEDQEIVDAETADTGLKEEQPLQP